MISESEAQLNDDIGVFKLKLKNSEEVLLLDERAYNFVISSKYFRAIDFLKNIRKHSHGYAFYQRFRSVKGIYTSETIYLHKVLAEEFVAKPLIKAGKKIFVHFKNGNPLDCRLKNLQWVTMSELRRLQKKRESESGFRGVVAEGPTRFKAIIYKEGKPIVIGIYKSALAAAKAYNRKSLEMFGEGGFQNEI